jgi:two-component system, OmpR family, sensor histidine kinase TctE
VSRHFSSLKWPLIVRPLAFQFIVLFLSFPLMVATATRLDSGGPFVDESITPVIAGSIVIGSEGDLVVHMTHELEALHRELPNLWFVVADDAGRRASFGDVPSAYGHLLESLPGFSYGHVRGRLAPYTLSVVIRRETSSFGPLTVMAHGRLTSLGFAVIAASIITALPIFLVLVLVSVFVVPWIVNRSLAGVARIAAEAALIDAGRRGIRLSGDAVPNEIKPLVKAVNDALERLDQGFEQQRRFIASAAHELRTPIAILRLKVDSSREPSTRMLAGDVARLANLAEQMLDLQRLEADWREEDLHLALLVRHVVADIAPLVITAGGSVEVQIEDPLVVRGDAGAIGRAIDNLVQNAVHHGGRNVIVRVLGTAIEVEDDGPGIPLEAHERVFEPFYRLSPRSIGGGLGLHLVQQVIERHGGHVSLTNASGGGVLVRVQLPAAGKSGVIAP